MNCSNCGAPLETSGDNINNDGLCSNCRNKFPNVVGLSGWICPVCGRGNSPYTAICPCRPLENRITC